VTKDITSENKPQKNTLERVYNIIGKAIYSLFKEGDIDRMENLDKAKSLAEELKGILETLPEESVEEVKKSLGIAKIEEEVVKTEPEPEVVPSLTMDDVVAKAAEMLEAKATEILEKSRLELVEKMEEVSADFTSKMAEVSTKIDALAPITEKISSIDSLSTSFEEVKKSLSERMDVIENMAPESKVADGVDKSKVDVPVVSKSIW